MQADHHWREKGHGPSPSSPLLELTLGYNFLIIFSSIFSLCPSRAVYSKEMKPVKAGIFNPEKSNQSEQDGFTPDKSRLENPALASRTVLVQKNPSQIYLTLLNPAHSIKVVLVRRNPTCLRRMEQLQ